MTTSESNSHPTRRTFVKSSLAAVGGIAATHTLSAKSNPTSFKELPLEWRNKQSGMTYRKLGRTGLMVSEIVIGGSSSKSNLPGKTGFFREAIDMGVNYLDTAPAYQKLKGEEGWGELLQDGLREKVFLATKISNYQGFIGGLCRELYSGLPAEKQNQLQKRAQDMLAEREVRKSGYFVKFFENHGRKLDSSYLHYIIRKEYGFSKKWKNVIEQKMRKSLEDSLKRLKTDYVDVLHFPHGCAMPEELEDEIHVEMTEKFKSEGKVRFTAFSSHTDQPRVLTRAAELGHIDVGMVAYNFVNQGIMEAPIEKAHKAGMGIIAMKAANVVSHPIAQNKDFTQWRVALLNTAIPGDMPLAHKAYIWALQNQKLSAVISQMSDAEMMRSNLTLVGKRVEINMV